MHLSSFYRPLVVRSMCLAEVHASVPECPKFPDVFVRDLMGLMEFGRSTFQLLARTRFYNTSELDRRHTLRFSSKQKWPKVKQYSLSYSHPCKHLTAAACQRDFTAALQ